MTPQERQAFFDQNGYWPTTFVPRKDVQRQAGSRSESEHGPLVGSIRQNLFHLPSCKWMRNVHRLDKVVFGSTTDSYQKSHAEAVAAGRKPCKTCRA